MGSKLVLALLALAGASLTASLASQPMPQPGAPPKAAPPQPYLPSEAHPDGIALLPPPPSPGSAALQRDEEMRTAMEALRGTPRWDRAASDADLSYPHAPDTFSCAAGVRISPATTPRLYALMVRMRPDVSASTSRAKDHYRRPRPFMVHAGRTCTPDDEAALRTNGSYPSGHSALGWAWGLVLAEVDPDRADAILRRGRDFGQSRVVCNVHWQSDVEAGRIVADAVIARLHGDATFRADLDAARAEVAAARQAGATPHGDCAAEAASLAMP